jgi:hypothetical protein
MTTNMASFVMKKWHIATEIQPISTQLSPRASSSRYDYHQATQNDPGQRMESIVDGKKM